jgi:hypothetical protein
VVCLGKSIGWHIVPNREVTKEMELLQQTEEQHWRRPRSAAAHPTRAVHLSGHTRIWQAGISDEVMWWMRHQLELLWGDGSERGWVELGGRVAKGSRWVIGFWWMWSHININLVLPILFQVQSSEVIAAQKPYEKGT